MAAQIKTYRAAWVIPIDRDPIRNGLVTVADDLIVSLKPAGHEEDHANVVDLGKVAIIPGLINAHTHLEFSHLKQPLGRHGMPFTDWIREIVTARRNVDVTSAEKADAIGRGLRESFAAGVWCVGEIATTPIRGADYLTELPIQTILFHEQLGSDERAFAEKLSQVESLFVGERSKCLQVGVSPHAPYSVHPRLLAGLVALGSTHDVPVAMHVAETLAERELLEHQTGPFVQLLKDFGAWDQVSSRPVQSIASILKSLGTAKRSLVVHGNYLTDAEIELIAKIGDRMSVVFCPRTHNYFEHAEYPLERLRAQKIRIAVGTDSRASNPDLNLFSELKLIAEIFPQVPSEEILAYGTLHGAQALGVENSFGSLTVGKRAALSLLDPPPGISGEAYPWQWIFDEVTVCRPFL